MILLLGGTSETAVLAGALAAAGHQVLVSTATDVPLDVGASAGVRRRSGRLDAAGLVALARREGAIAVVDASHPYAVELHAEARRATAELGLPYLRYARPESATADGADGVVRVRDHEEAARTAAGLGGTILLTTGSKDLQPYVRAARGAGVRLVARVLPHADSQAACRTAGLSAADVIAARGPFSVEENRGAIRRAGAKVLVTKESGEAGGLPEKLEAARLELCRVVLVGRPPESAAPGEAFGDVPALVAALQKAVRAGEWPHKPGQEQG